MSLFPEGNKLYSVLTRYSDLLLMDKREGFEPGDISALVVPFLLLHNIRLDDITDLAVGATITDGAANLISQIEYNGWKIFCLSSAYEQYVLHITQKLGIYAHRVACTPLPLNEMYQVLNQSLLDLISRAEQYILTTPETDDKSLRQKLDEFYFEQLPATSLATYLDNMKPVAGQRELDALNRFATKFDQPLSRWVMVGSRRTDSPALNAVKEAQGLAVAFNAVNEALTSATAAMASTSIRDLLDVLVAWQKGARNAAEKLVREKEKSAGREERGYYSWLPDKTDVSQISETHRRLRQLVLEKTGKP